MSLSLDAAERADRVARYYDLDLVDVSYDAELYQELAQAAGGPVLEMGVGSGRLAIPLALAGHHVQGIDADPAMLARAKVAWESARGDLEADRLQVQEADFLDYRTEQRFGLAFIAVNTFLLVPDDSARLALLGSMRSALRRGGIAAVEVSTPDAAELQRYDSRLQHEWLRTDPETGDQVSKSISADYDADAETVTLTQLYEWTAPHGGALYRVTNIDLLHLISADHLGELAREAGFEDVDLRGDHLPTPYGAGSHRAILVARLV
jgi:SAM-dependent methyltransferase